jgi:TetR/AcrR family transcriptional repressor of nem operon
MARDGSKTRTKIMDAAERLILEQGFGGTSIDRVIDDAEITKGTFFYHFKSKSDLAYALVERYARLDLGHLEENMRLAESRSDDPLEQLLIFVRLFEDSAEELAEPYPGCLFGSYCYEAGLFDETTLRIIQDTMLTWREKLGAKLAEVAKRYPPRRPVDMDVLAEMIVVIFEGGFILSRTLKEPRAVATHAANYRTYLELLFAPDAGRSKARTRVAKETA